MVLTTVRDLLTKLEEVAVIVDVVITSKVSVVSWCYPLQFLVSTAISCRPQNIWFSPRTVSSMKVDEEVLVKLLSRWYVAYPGYLQGRIIYVLYRSMGGGGVVPPASKKPHISWILKRCFRYPSLFLVLLSRKCAFWIQYFFPISWTFFRDQNAHFRERIKRRYGYYEPLKGKSFKVTMF